MRGMGFFEDFADVASAADMTDYGYGVDIAGNVFEMPQPDYSFYESTWGNDVVLNPGDSISWGETGADTWGGATADQSSSWYSTPEPTAVDAATVAQQAESAGLTAQFPSISLSDVTNLVKQGLSLYQAYNQISAQQKMQQRAGTTGGVYRDPRTGQYVRQTIDPRTGQLITQQIDPRTGQPIQTMRAGAGTSLVPGVSNTMLLAGAVGVGALLLMSGKRRR